MPAVAHLIAPELETERLRLRGARAADWEPFAAIWQDPDYYRYLTGAPDAAESVWRRLLGMAGHWVLMGYGYWAVEEKATGQLVGFVGFSDFRRALEPPFGEAPEIGWALAPRVHRQGYGSEAVRAALAWGEAFFGPVRTVCLIHPDNAASLALAHKVGYREYARTTYLGGPNVLLEREGPGKS